PEPSGPSHRVSLEPGLSSRMNGASEQSSPGFLNLPGVKTTKPELLENKFESLVEPVWEETSQEFQLLVSKLVHQHVKEVSLLEKQKASLKVSIGEMEGELTRLQTKEAIKTPKTPQSGDGDGLDCRSASLQRSRYKKKGTTVIADQILEVFEGDNGIEVEKKFETDFGKLLRAGTKYETSETEEDRVGDLTFFQRLRMWLQSNAYEMCMAFILCLNVLWMALESQIDGLNLGSQIGIYPPGPEQWELSFMIGDVFFTSLFALDVLVRICVLQRLFFKSCMNYVDLVVSATSLAEMTLTVSMSLNPVLFRLLRIGKLFRAVRMVHMTNMLASLHLLVKCLIASCNMLFWSFCLLTFLQCVSGLVISTLCKEYIASEMHEMKAREDVFLYFGTFTRTFLTMFEILFANWGPPCRVLIENVSEWFSVFFLLYRCVLGFAVVNVVNAVFVQQTMKTASTDEELAFKQKEKDIALYTRKVRNLFQSMDASGDGAINLEEFAKLVKSPKLKFWMSQLELEYHDLLSLFEFLDNGDGEITLMEFIEGAGRLRGNAKALDIWRVETKLEVLFERVLRALPAMEASEAAAEAASGAPSVQEVFDHSVQGPRMWNQGRLLERRCPGISGVWMARMPQALPIL
ncbi:unnamed protein product, partial [Effrenium voratum]